MMKYSVNIENIILKNVGQNPLPGASLYSSSDL